MFNLPNRITGDISQTFSDGYVEIYINENVASNGDTPYYKKSSYPKARYRFAEQRVGINRYYSAKQLNVQVDRVVRIPYRSDYAIKVKDIVNVNGNGSHDYRVEQVQIVNDTNPRCLDLSLSLVRWGV